MRRKHTSCLRPPLLCLGILLLFLPDYQTQPTPIKATPVTLKKALLLFSFRLVTAQEVITADCVVRLKVLIVAFFGVFVTHLW